MGTVFGWLYFLLFVPYAVIASWLFPHRFDPDEMAKIAGIGLLVWIILLCVQHWQKNGSSPDWNKRGYTEKEYRDYCDWRKHKEDNRRMEQRYEDEQRSKLWMY